MSSKEQSASPDPEFGAGQRNFITGALALGSISAILTSTVINVVIPDIMGAFGVGQDKAQWLTTGHLAATTSSMLLTDWFIRRLGRDNTYFLAMAVFIAGSVIGGVAATFDQLIVGRVLQGIGAGISQPLAMGTLFMIFPRDQRGRAMGIYGMIIILGPAFGPFVGGLTADALSWRWVYFVPIPFSAVAGILGLFLLPGRDAEAARPPFDWIGYTLLIVFIPSFLVALTNGAEDGWYSDQILSLFAIAGISFVGFILWQLYTPKRLLDLNLFTYPRFAMAAIISFLFGAGMFGIMYLVPIFSQLVQGYTPTKAGLLQMPAGFMMALAMPLAGRLVDKGWSSSMFIGGLSLTAFSGVLMTDAHIETAFWVFAGWLIMNRVGQAVIFTTMATASLAALPPHLVGQGPGVMNFVRSIGSVFGVNVMALYVEQRLQTYRQILAGSQNAGNPETLEYLETVRRLLEQAGLAETIREPAAFFYLNQAIYQQANMLAFRDGFMFFAILTAAGLIPAIILSRTAATPEERDAAAGRRSRARQAVAEAPES
ncbi:MAG: DHA2 family efflux MFS transporter permease subunit [Rhodospirillales bacterium]|nr:DHA2 family efflux MFS transporter permease subunit [Rhodospirillales bacterium]MDP6645001.1 DHA2 family efflux MFS transporter permease subunit [Rhodospirillales bacterium]MDP6841974.1 DHA2 family efflux MFS transporter permease subunit [Rhodospirillales bacterium]